MVRFLKIISLLLIVESCYAHLSYAMFHGGLVKTTKWYFAPNGNDDNHGHSADAPLQTVAKLNTLTLKPGDSVLFHAGSTFAGQINVNQSGTAVNPIVFTSYGSGAKPIIKGSKLLTNWVARRSYYACKANAVVKNLFANGVQQTIARYPNVGYGSFPMLGFIPISTTNGTTTITANAITQANHYWDGANVRVRSVDWSFETRIVTYNGTTLTLNHAATFTLNVNEGFYLDNILAALDTVGEWYYSSTTDSVYYWAQGGVNPNTLIVEGSVYDYGITSSKSNITVQNLAFDKQANTAINFTGTDSCITIKSNSITNSYTNGICVSGASTKDTITNNIINGTNENGINAYYATYSNISGNTIKNCALVLGINHQGYGILVCSGNYNTINGNTIDSIGYTGIFPCKNSSIMYNTITHTMLSLSDGAAIYISGSLNSTVRHNIISDVVGNPSGTTLWTLASIFWLWTSAHGIYLDQSAAPNPTRLIQVDSNTVIRARSCGVFLNYSDTSCTVRDNTFYDCATNTGGAGLFCSIDTTRPGYGTLTFANNIIFSKSRNSLFKIEQRNLYKWYQSPGRIDSNFYATTVGTMHFNHHTSNPEADHLYTLTQWRDMTGHDAHATILYKTYVATDSVAIFVNNTNTTTSTTLRGIWHNLDGTIVSSPLSLAPYSSKILSTTRLFNKRK